MSLKDFLDVLVRRYEDRPDEFIITIGHQTMPYPNKPVTIFNLPEIQGDVSITVGDLRRWSGISLFVDKNTDEHH